MAEEKDDEKEVKTEEEPKSKKKLILIIVAVLVVVLAAGGGAAFFFMSKGKHGGKAEGKKAETKTEKSEKGGDVKEGGPILALEPFVVNLSDTEGTRYLKVVMQLELPNEELNKEVTEKTPQIRDEIIMLLSSKSYDDLSTAPGKRSLKRALLESVNRYLTTGKATNVYFSDFVIQ